MQPHISLVIKVIILSVLLSIFIKYGGRLLSIEPNSINALIAILLPALIMSGLLLFRIYLVKNN